MKFLCKLLAALLLWIFIACNDSGKNGGTTEKQAADSGGAAAQYKNEDLTIDNSLVFPSPAPTVWTNEYTVPKMVKDCEEMHEEAPKPYTLEEKIKDFKTEDYDHIVENRFLAATQHPLSTFSIDVDEAAYSNVRRYINNGIIPHAGAVRIHPVTDSRLALAAASDNFRFSAAVASFGMLLRDSEFKQNASFQQVLDLAKGSKGADTNGYRQEFISLVRAAGSLTVKK
ncbi:YfbK domain-containing protein [Niastella populi]|uniref:Uncharacterized protein YfbK C-terminal domain-containing protein n=1 Tax=Niastella populi TaxID=550983 RepID=A0A1V9G237_9BACT|nr:von Willebrand factor type A domain-containing protein [Niastella populi]OQP64536.1 hypothetical protein A4R26_15915 [Niastella populi]